MDSPNPVPATETHASESPKNDGTANDGTENDATSPAPTRSLARVCFVLFASGFLFLLASAAAYEIGRHRLTDPVTDATDELDQILSNHASFAISVLLPQASLVVLPLILALTTPPKSTRSLGLRRTTWPWWGVVGASLFAPLLSLVASLIAGGIWHESEALQQTAYWLRFHGRGSFFLPLIGLIAVVPALCEELLFRGFIQPSLATRLPNWIAICIASGTFALFHMDPIHIITVLPLGLWLGWLTHASGSLYPAMLAHGTNNALAVILVTQTDGGLLAPPPFAVTMALTVAGAIGFLLVLRAQHARRTTSTPVL